MVTSKTIRFLIILTLLFPKLVSSQILNIDRIIQFKKGFNEAQNLYTSLGSAFNILSEGKRTMQFSLTSDLTYLTQRDAFIWITQHDFTNAKAEQLVNTGYTQMVYRFKHMKKRVPEFIVQYQWNAPLGLLDRWLYAGNMRFNVLSDSTYLILFKTGLMYELEKWQYFPTGETVKQIKHNENVKLNVFVKYMQKVSDTFDFTVASYAQSPLNSNFKYFRISPLLVFNFKISNKLEYEVKSQMSYDFLPAVPIDKMQFRVTNKLKINF